MDYFFDNLIGGECYCFFDVGEIWERLNDLVEIDVSGKVVYSFNKINVDFNDFDKIFIIGIGMYYMFDGGKIWF